MADARKNAAAPNLGSFKEYCTCGGYAWAFNGRPIDQPHNAACPQAAEYAEWIAVPANRAALVAIAARIGVKVE